MKKLSYAVSALALTVTAGTALSTPAQAQAEPYLGDIILVGFTFCPRGYVNAHGQLLPISSNQALFSLYGTIYGGDGRTTFAVPDMRGRIPVGFGDGPGLDPTPLGARFGTETHTMTVAEMPQHNHTMNATTTFAAEESPQGNSMASYAQGNAYSPATPTVPMNNAAVSNTGGAQAFSITTPSLVMRYCVATTGLFPPRN